MAQALKKSPWLRDLVLISMLSVFAWAALLSPDYFLGAHDAPHSLFFLTEFHQNIVEGTLIPRWGTDHAWGYGYPTFIFYSPLAFYVAEAFHLLGLSKVVAVKITFILAFIFSGWAMYGYARRLFGRGAGLVAALVYIYMPYHLVDIYVRCALSEFCAFVFLPLVLWAFYELIGEGGARRVAFAALSYAGLILTHNATFLLFTPILALYVLFLLLHKGWSTKRWGAVIWAFLLAFALSAFFLLPMFAERKYISLEQWTRATYSYDEHFIYPAQFLSPFWDWGYSVAGPEDTMPFQLGLPALALALFAVVWRWRNGHVLLFLGIALGAIFFMTSASTSLWQALPIAALVQFPWRLLALTTISLSVLAGAACQVREDGGLKAAVYVLLLVIVFASSGYARPEYTPPPERAETPLGVLDFERAHPDMVGMTAWSQFQPETSPLVEQYLAGGPLVKAHILEGEGEVEPVRHGGASEEALVRAAGEITLQFYTYYYPGWRGYVDGKWVEIWPEPPLGLITMKVPAGEHRVSIKFRDIPVRVAGKVISTLGAAAVFLLLTRAVKTLPQVQEPAGGSPL